jgi:hypothetical protein
MNSDNQTTNDNNTYTQNQYPLEFEEVEGGVYDNYGCYLLPDGSFWDPNGVFFNKDGLDSNGGFYDEDFLYHPGQNWNEEFQCYNTEQITNLPLNHQQRLMEGVQSRLSEEYDNNRNLFRDVGNNNFDVNEVDCDRNGMDIDDDNELINSWIDGNLIQKGSHVEQSAKKFQSASKTLEVQNENTNPNRMTFEGNVSNENLGTPFKTKTSEIMQEGTPFQTMSVKKVTLTTPNKSSQF